MSRFFRHPGAQFTGSRSKSDSGAAGDRDSSSDLDENGGQASGEHLRSRGSSEPAFVPPELRDAHNVPPLCASGPAGPLLRGVPKTSIQLSPGFIDLSAVPQPPLSISSTRQIGASISVEKHGARRRRAPLDTTEAQITTTRGVWGPRMGDLELARGVAKWVATMSGKPGFEPELANKDWFMGCMVSWLATLCLIVR